MTPLTVGKRLFCLNPRGNVMRIGAIERLTFNHVFVPQDVRLDRTALDDQGYTEQADSSLTWWTEEAIGEQDHRAGLPRGTLLTDDQLEKGYSISLSGKEPSMTTRKPALPQRHAIPKLRREIGDEVYDTETASVLHHHRYDDDDDDDDDDEDDGDGMLFAFGSVLLLTVSGRHFVVDYNETGDPDSAWLRPVTTQEAVAWAVLHCPSLVEEIFGRLHEAGGGPPFTPAGPRKLLWPSGGF